MSNGELVVDPDALKAFASALQDHTNALGVIVNNLQQAQPVEGDLFGKFSEAGDLNARASTLLQEMSAKLATATNSLFYLGLAAQNGALLYMASDAKSKELLASIDQNLGQIEGGTYSAGAL